MNASAFGSQDTTLLMMVGGLFCCAMGVGIAINAFVCYLLSGYLKALPEEYRKQTPGKVWLLMIPLFGMVWAFFVYPQISESYDAYFRQQGRTDHGDAGRGLGMACAILMACSMAPYVGMFAALASLVVQILYLVKINGYKKELKDAAFTGGLICARCHYNLRGNTTGVCPECGTPVPIRSFASVMGPSASGVGTSLPAGSPSPTDWPPSSQR